MAQRKFSLGQVVATPGALELLSPERIADILTLHLSCHWGIVDKDDWKANDVAVREGTRIFSAYHIIEDDPASGKVWCITEGENNSGIRQSTCLLLPDEY